MPIQRDPASEMFDQIARRGLNRAYATPGRWIPVRLPRLTARLFIHWYTRNTDLRASDPFDPSITRYVRAFVRAAYYQHAWYGDFDGVRSMRRSSRWDGLRLVYQATQDGGGWRVRLMAAPAGDPRLPAKAKPPFNLDSHENKGIRIGGLGAGEAV